MNALELFRSGLDYLSIGEKLGMHEADVERAIHGMRRPHHMVEDKRDDDRRAYCRGKSREWRERNRRRSA